MVARLRAAARERGLKLTHVPDLAGVSRSHFWDVMAGRKNPTVRWLVKITSPLQCEPADLLGGPAPPRAVPSRIRENHRVPLLSLRPSAGGFTEPEEVESLGEVKVPSRREVKQGMFAATVSGRSMEPTIPDGAICLFRPMDGRDPNGKRVLVQLRDARDPETGGRYTLKRFKVVGRRAGQVTRIRLEPLNREHKAMVLQEDPMSQLTVVAEFLEVLVPPAR